MIKRRDETFDDFDQSFRCDTQRQYQANTVSYTHLDVYKRQTITQIDGFVNLHFANKVAVEHSCQYPSWHGDNLIVHYVEWVGYVPRFELLQIDVQAMGMGFPNHPVQGDVG